MAVRHGQPIRKRGTAIKVKEVISVRNARQNNLQGIDVDLPRRSLIVLTGPSGSGKSTLAFDTIYAEGQRRYVESLSTYAKHFLERMEKPAVDAIDGISPAVAIEQVNPTKSNRSTVGTATEIHDYLRLLWARVGRTHCPECERVVRPDTVQSATDQVMELPDGTRILITFPLPPTARVSHQRIVENLSALGFVRVLAQGRGVELDGPEAKTPEGLGLDLAAKDDLLVIVDRLVTGAEIRERLADSLGTCFVEGEGEAVVVAVSDEAPDHRLRFSERFRCPDHPEVRFVAPVPRLFSFNHSYGSCPRCTGFGARLEYDPELIVPDVQLSLADGAVEPWEMPRYRRQRQRLLSYAVDQGVDTDAEWCKLPLPFRESVLHGTRGFTGVVPFLRSREKKRYKQYIRVFLRRYQTARRCPGCAGARLRPEALYVRVAGLNIAEAAGMSLTDLLAWVRDLAVPTEGDGPLSAQEQAVAASILRELLHRLAFLEDVGLGYLTLDRQARTLSGGEAQRIALANSLGANLVDTLFVLDEPTVGLHPRDTQRMLRLLHQLRDRGNTVIVVEHEPLVISAADHVLELGPGGGGRGGRVVYEGGYRDLPGQETETGRYLAGEVPVKERRGHRHRRAGRLILEGASLHNLQDVDVEFPLGMLSVVTGVSGSGKSTLVHDILYRGLERELAGRTSAKRHLGEVVGRYRRLDGAAGVDAVVLVDQSPIGRTPRSNPVTYIKAFDHIRSLFARQPLARKQGFRAGDFSFNVKGGRCEVCQGAGMLRIEMVFLADVYSTCEACGGSRYRPEVLEVTYKGLNIREVLDLTVDQAIRFFLTQDRLGQALWQLQQVGLGYLRLGQPAPSLSGGEAQRLKIARELTGAGRKRGSRLYILDEPTTGLSGSEVARLLDVLGRLLDVGHTVIVIEHNMDVIRAADWIVDLGPEAGSAGGQVVAMGSPSHVAAVEEGYTGCFLRQPAGAWPPSTSSIPDESS